MEQHYALIIACMLLAKFFLDATADILNLKALKQRLPDEFNGVFDAETYRKSQEYTSVRTTF